VRRNLIRF